MSAPAPPTLQVDRRGNEGLVMLGGDWLVRQEHLRVVGDLPMVLSAVETCVRLRFDTTSLGQWDSDPVGFVQALQGWAGSAEGRPDVELTALPEALQRLLALAQADHGQPIGDVPRATASVAQRVGVRVFRAWGHLVESTDLIRAVVLTIIPALLGRIHARFSDLIALMQDCGIGALGIIAVVNSLVGAILAFVGAIQLQRFGAGIYIANLVGVAMTREMAPIMTAIVMTGRTGGAYAAQISTMQGSEEIDALRVLGIPPIQYLVLPRVAALIGMMPVLYVYGCLMGLAGGLVVSVAMLGLSPTMFLWQLRKAVDPAEFYIGVTKSICFGAFIAISSCQIGLRAGRSAAEVGRAATGELAKQDLVPILTARTEVAQELSHALARRQAAGRALAPAEFRKADPTVSLSAWFAEHFRSSTFRNSGEN